MWARSFELAIGAWLAASPFLLAPTPHRRLAIVVVVAGCGVMILAGASLCSRWRRAHLGTLVLASVITAAGWWASRTEPDAHAQNAILAGLVLAMFAIVPTEAARPPVRWREFLAARGDRLRE